MNLFLLTLLTLLVFQFFQLIYVLSQSCAGMLLGTKVLCNSIGAGPLCYQRKLFKIDWQLRLIPFSSFTKFASDEDLVEENFLHTDAASFHSFTDLPLTSKFLILLAGPASSILVGLLLLWVATHCNASKVAVALPEGQLISPSAVPQLTWNVSRANWQSHQELIQQSVLTYVPRLFTFQSLTGWGGPVGCMVTCAAALSQSPPAWLTCFGIICFSIGVMNLLPIPVLNGGTLLLYILKAMSGSELETFTTRANWFGIFVTFFVWFRLIYLDLTWGFSQLF